MLGQGIKTFKFAKNLKDMKSEDPLIQNKAKNYIYDLCKKNGGLYTKIVQYMGNIDGSNESLQDWQEQLDAVLDREQILSLLADAWEKDPFTILSHLSEEYYPASIGQVVKGELNTGESVAIKLQYPHVESSIRNQLDLLGLLPKAGKLSQGTKWGVDFKMYENFISNTLFEELDYNNEKIKQLEFKNLFQDENDIDVPAVFESLSDRKVFVTEFINGIKFRDFCRDFSKDDRRKMAERIFRSFLISLFKKNEFHCDPNPYNFIFQEDKLYLIDFGQTHKLSNEFVTALRDTYLGIRDQKKISPIQLFSYLGFDETKLIHIKELLPTVAEILLRPFLEPYAFDLKNWNYSEQLKMILGDKIWYFRAAGGKDFFALMKTFAGLKEMIKELEINLFYHRIIENILKDPTITWSRLDISDDNAGVGFKVEAQSICIKAVKDGVEKVRLTMPSGALLDLPNMIEQDVKEKLDGRGLILSEIIRDTISKGVKPGLIFDLTEGNDQVKIWLE